MARALPSILTSNVTFSRGVELQFVECRKPHFEVVPDIRSQPIAVAHPDPVLRLQWMGFGAQQVAASSPMYWIGCSSTGYVVPELACGEVFADHYRAAGDKTRQSQNAASCDTSAGNCKPVAGSSSSGGNQWLHCISRAWLRWRPSAAGRAEVYM